MEKSGLSENCEHVWKKSGLWDGWDGTGERRINTGGPVAVCVNCNGKKNFTWDQWKEQPEKEDVDQEE